MAYVGETRTPLGLPQGSVRAILALLITVSFWLMVLLPNPENGKPLHVPLNLYFLLAFPFMFFVSYGRSMADAEDNEPHPLGMPPFLVKFIILFGTAGVLGFQYHYNFDQLKARLTPDAETLQNGYRFAAALFGGFMFGYIMRALPFRNSALFQFFHAWLSMIAMILLVIEIVIHAFIQPSMEGTIDVVAFEIAITAIVATYFATRS